MGTTLTPPLVSVLCATFNHEKYIADAIQGFLKQQCDFEFEILIQDDASTDGTAEVIKAFVQQYPNRIHPILYKENQLQKGIRPFPSLAKYAKGRYIALCEGDDYWHDPLKLQKQVDAIDADECISLVTSDVDVLHQRKGRLVKSVFRRTGNMPQSYEDLTLGLLTRKYIFITCTFLLRRQSYLDIIESNSEEFSGKWPFGDMQLMLEFSRLGRIHFIPVSLATYRKLEESASSSRNPGHHARNIVALLDCTEHYARKFGYGDDVTRCSRASLIGSLAGFALRFSSETLRKQVLELMERYPFPISDSTTRMVFWVVQSEQRLSKYSRLLSIYLECLRLYRRATNRAVALLR